MIFALARRGWELISDRNRLLKEIWAVQNHVPDSKTGYHQFDIEMEVKAQSNFGNFETLPNSIQEKLKEVCKEEVFKFIREYIKEREDEIKGVEKEIETTTTQTL